MKRVITTLFLLLPLAFLLSFSASYPLQDSSKAVVLKIQENSETVYICTGKYSKRYHAYSDCSGLNNCKGDIIAISKKKAQNLGRTPCKICYY